jgi:hypothetical protein
MVRCRVPPPLLKRTTVPVGKRHCEPPHSFSPPLSPPPSSAQVTEPPRHCQPSWSVPSTPSAPPPHLTPRWKHHRCVRLSIRVEHRRSERVAGHPPASVKSPCHRRACMPRRWARLQAVGRCQIVVDCRAGQPWATARELWAVCAAQAGPCQHCAGRPRAGPQADSARWPLNYFSIFWIYTNPFKVHKFV